MSSVSRYASNSRYSARGEGLQAVPADVEVIADTLRSLDLSANELQALLLPASLPVLDELLLADNLLDAPTLQRLRPALPATLRILDLTANRLVAFHQNSQQKYSRAKHLQPSVLAEPWSPQILTL